MPYDAGGWIDECVCVFAAAPTHAIVVCLTDLVLQELWAGAPDAASSTPMPYAGRMADLLAGDPFLQLHGVDAPGGKQGVKLTVQAIKAVIRF